MDEILFYAFGAVAVAAALLSVSRKDAVAAACWLVVMFFGLAGEFVLLEAYFVAAIQILVYAGAIMVLFLFVIMLLDLRRAELLAHGGPRLKFVGVALSVVFLLIVGKVLLSARQGEGVAERVTASLTLPAPPPAPPDSLTKVPEPPTAPGSKTVEIHEARLEDVRLDAKTAAWFATAHARPRVGWVEFPGRDGAKQRKRLLAAVAPDRSLWVWLDADADGTITSAEGLRTPRTGSPENVEERAEFGGAAFGADPKAVLSVSAVYEGLGAAPGGGPDGSPRAIGTSLFTDWILPFEITSVLLLGAIFGAVVLTKRRLA